MQYNDSVLLHTVRGVICHNVLPCSFTAHKYPAVEPAVFFSFEFQLGELMGQFCPIKSFQMSIVSFSFYVRDTDGEKREMVGWGKWFRTGRKGKRKTGCVR